ncbi:MAG: amino acid permease [Deltaproteobacteria bacterium]|nr:amino acid permease [Deltaproteobacteria bacterium]
MADGIAESDRAPGRLRRVLGTWDLTLLGVGAIVGAGIFSSIGQMAAGTEGQPGAGPALIVSYLLTAGACALAALCYAEIAALVPVAGSAYSYAYAALGEIWAWIIGWDLIIEYAIGNVYVAQSWTDYFRSFLRGAAGVDLPAWMATDLQTAAMDPQIAAIAPRVGDFVIAFNLPAAAITVVLTLLLCAGIRETTRVGNVLVLFKLALITTFIVVGAFYVQPVHWHPFAPGGWRGIWTGASLAFFSYIGFDALSTAAEESRDPERTVPRAMLASLGICAVLYVAVAAVMTGLSPSSELGTGDPLSRALRLAGLDGLATVMALGSVVAVTVVLLVFQMGQARILLAMARDGLLPRTFARVHGRRRTPVVGTLLTGAFVAVAPTFLTPAQALELTSIGTLFAFIVVAVGVIALRVREPSRHRPFRCPGYPVTPLATIAACLALMLGLPAANWWRFGVWLAVGLLIYAVGRHRTTDV